MMTKLIATPTEAAKMLKVRIATVYELLETGEIPGYKEGTYWKIPATLLEQYVCERAMKESSKRRERNEKVSH